MLKSYSIQEIKEKLTNMDTIESEFIEQLRQDDRKGVQVLIKRYDKEREKIKKLQAMHERMTVMEQQLQDEGFTYIAGIDEVGRGPLAGPVVAAAVILPSSFQLLGLTDSKKLTKEKREHFAEIIKREAVAYSIAMVPASVIDEINIYEATKKVMIEAVQALQVKPEYLLVDAMTLQIKIPQQSLIKGDEKSISIAASSVLAKVARDQYMEKLDNDFPNYGFAKNAGYGTKQHLGAIENGGLTPEHRRSFRPVKEAKLI